MQNATIRRAAASVSVMTMTAGLVSAMGMGTASADPAQTNYSYAGMSFTRIISDGSPHVGDTITAHTTVAYPGSSDYQTINYFTDRANDCLDYIANSAKVDGTAYAFPSDESGSVMVYGPWVTPTGESRTFDFSYRVSARCAIGMPLNSGFEINAPVVGSIVAGIGPMITVQKAVSATTLTVSPAPQAGAESVLTATVAPNSAPGEIEFYDGDDKLGTSPLTDGTATYRWTPATAGHDFALTAKYTGDATTAGSTSDANAGTVTAAPAPPAKPTSLAATPNTVRAGEKVTITGNAEPLAAITVTAGTQTCDATANSTGDFSCEITTGAPGTLTVTAAATLRDLTSQPSDPITVTVTDGMTTIALGSLVLYFGSLGG